MDTRTVKFESSDNQVFDVSIEVAKLSVTVQKLLEDAAADTDSPICLPEVTGKVMANVIDWCQLTITNPPTEEELKKETNVKNIGKKYIRPADEKFFEEKMEGGNLSPLYDLLMAANFLDINRLLMLTASRVAWEMYGKTPEEIRQRFNIENDLTPEDEEEVLKQYGLERPSVKA